MNGPCWRDPGVGCGCRDGVDRAMCSVPFTPTKGESMYDRHPDIQDARLVFTVDAAGEIRLVKNSYSCLGGANQVDLQVMVEKVENLRLAACGSAMRYDESGAAEMVELEDGDYDPASPIGGPYRAPDGCTEDCGIDSRCSDDCGFDSEKWESENDERLGDSSVELPEPELGTCPPPVGPDAVIFLIESDELILVEVYDNPTDVPAPADDPEKQEEWGDTGVFKTGLGAQYDAADDLENRGIDATANSDLVEAWAHALEVADATD